MVEGDHHRDDHVGVHGARGCDVRRGWLMQCPEEKPKRWLAAGGTFLFEQEEVDKARNGSAERESQF